MKDKDNKRGERCRMLNKRRLSHSLFCGGEERPIQGASAFGHCGIPEETH
jgi:hypothetical protein